MVVVAVFLALTCLLMCLYLAMLLTNRPIFDERFEEEEEEEDKGPVHERDPGQVPSPLVEEVTLALLSQQKQQKTQGSSSNTFPPSVRLERAWTRRDGYTAWQVLVCHFDRCDVDFGTRCESVRIEYLPEEKLWRIASKQPRDPPQPMRRPSSDALLLPGMSV